MDFAFWLRTSSRAGKQRGDGRSPIGFRSCSFAASSYRISMMDENPYRTSDSPTPFEPSTEREPLSLRQAALFVLVTSLIGGGLGTVAGACLGWLLPGYYRGVFAGGQATDFDPLAVGIGLGASQGAMLGSVAGLALVIAYWWFHQR